MSTLLAPANTETYTRLQITLRELFQLDQADLDFGIYRILNQRRAQVEDFLENKMPERVRAALQSNATGGHDDLRRELQQLETTLRGAGVDPDTNTKVLDLRKQLGTGASLEAMENEVFSLLTNFFKRYYQQGDFISLRRYKKDVYAIPYEGEEVKLHWANHDQYYIKTGEYFKQYRFSVPGGKWVNFEMKEASTEQANNKAAAGKERRFRLCEEDALHVDGDTLRIFFVYEALDKKSGQDELLKEAFERLAPALPAAYQAELLRPMPTDKQRDRTLLHKRLKDYTARNTFDYFIHKDLGGFLRRELDFFIKNEVLLLDDLHLDDEHKYAAQLRTVKALKAAATPVIEFLEQLENFQKKLWLKKKFVVETNWCITLDRVPKELYAEIAANAAQREEWKKLFHIQDIAGYSEPLTVPFLEANPYLVLDTKYFAVAKEEDKSLRNRVIANIENLDEQTEGLLVHSENFQALQLLQARYEEQVKCIYIDPPYNTGEDGFPYKDNYQHSTWLAMMHDRVSLARATQAPDSALYASINEDELSRLLDLLDELYGSDMYISNFSVKVRHENRILKGDKAIHEVVEYLPAYRRSVNHVPTKRLEDNTSIEEYEWTVAPNANATEILVLGGKQVKAFAPGEYQVEQVDPDTAAFNRINIRGTLREGNSSGRFYVAHLEPLAVRYAGYLFQVPDMGSDGLGYRHFLLPEAGSRRRNGDYFQGVPTNRADTKLVPYANLLDFEKHFNRSTDEGGVEFRNGKKPIAFVNHVLMLAGVKQTKQATTLDFFAGSGTTGHAVVELNRDDGGHRKYILVEMGEYFESVTKPRMQKVSHSRKWKKGKPEGRVGISQCFKTIRLESYEDVLNNLQVHKASAELFGNGRDGFAEDHLLHYALDVESRESLLNVRSFADPFNYRLRITRHNEVQEERIDLVETFNYLIGLVVHHRQWMSGFHVVTGALLSGEKVLIIWRKTTEQDNPALEAFFKKRQYNPRDTEFDLIYVNGDNTLENLRTEPEHWKVRLIEDEFLKRMWEGKDV